MDTNNFLFHFSTAASLRSIVTKRQLWATDVNYLNDKFEGKLGIKVLTWMADNPESYLLGFKTCPKHLHALKHSLTHGLVMHTVSFSEHYRSLPQYRMYCPPAGGYAIGFPKEYLNGLGQFIQCDYSNENLMRWFREYAEDFLKDAEVMDNSNISAENLDAKVRSNKTYIEKRVIAELSFKSAEFEHENEHRLIVPGAPNTPGSPTREYRESQLRNTLIPYRIVTLPNDAIEVCIAAGPNRDAGYAGRTIGSLSSAASDAGTKWQFSQRGTGEYGFRE